MKNSQRVTLEAVCNPGRFRYKPGFAQRGITFATDKVNSIMRDFVHQYPSAASENLIYAAQDNATDWVNGFWTGMLWLSYELTGNELFRAVAEAQFDDYQYRLDNYLGLAHHDIGFLYVPSIVAQYKITGARKARDLSLRAAELLAKRFSPGAGIIQVRDHDRQGLFIVDCCMNLPLLFYAAQQTGDRSFYLKALSHITQVCNYTIRDDASTFQRFQIDELTAEPVGGGQGQGYNDQSCWARGQSWVICGLALAYRYTLEPEFLELAKRTANYFLNRLPSDHICNWDLIFTQDDDPRDSSTAPIAACGLLELAKYLPEGDPHKGIYHNAACGMLMSLTDHYLTEGKDSNGLLLHGVYTKKTRPGKVGKGCGDDECCIWGDYFYLEGLMRVSKDWNQYW